MIHISAYSPRPCSSVTSVLKCSDPCLRAGLHPILNTHTHRNRSEGGRGVMIHTRHLVNSPRPCSSVSPSNLDNRQLTHGMVCCFLGAHTTNTSIPSPPLSSPDQLARGGGGKDELGCSSKGGATSSSSMHSCSTTHPLYIKRPFPPPPFRNAHGLSRLVDHRSMMRFHRRSSCGMASSDPVSTALAVASPRRL